MKDLDLGLLKDCAAFFCKQEKEAKEWIDNNRSRFPSTNRLNRALKCYDEGLCTSQEVINEIMIMEF